MKDLLSVLVLFFLVTILISISSVILGIMYGIPSGNVALIKIHEEIFPIEGLFQDTSTSDSIIALLDSAETNPNVEAIVLSINSPGGTIVASREVANRVANMSKPVIAWIRDLGTSGAYLIASSADYIISDEFSMVGSIGSTINFLEFSETLSEYGVEYISLVSGDYKDMGSMYRNMTSEEEEMFMTWINESFNYFLNYVTNQRSLSSTSVEEVSDGRLFSGSQALELGLVDELGGKVEVINYLNSLNITEVVLEEYTNSNNNLLLELSSLMNYRASSVFPTYD